MKTNLKMCLVLTVCWPLLFAIAAKSETRVDAGKAAAIAGQVGVSTAAVWLNHKSVVIAPSSLPPEERNAKIEAALKKYEAVKNGYAVVSSATTGTKAVVGGVIAGAILYAGPQAAVTVPLTLIGAASAISLDMTKSKVESIGLDRSKVLLASIKDELIKEAGVGNYSELVSDPKLLKATLLKSDKFLQDIKARADASGDPGLKDLAADVVTNAARQVDIATLESIATLASDAKKRDKSFSSFIEETRKSNKRVEKALTDHGKVLEEIAGGVAVLGEKMTAIDAQVTLLGKNQDLIADFMFSSLPPDQKAAALQSGLMDNRIRCPIDKADCNPEMVKGALIDGYLAEAKIQENVALAGKIISGVNDIQNITTNLGIELGEDGNRALEIAGAAAGAYVNFMSGNYLGALSSVSSIFGSKKNAEAERFKIMMAYLQQQFGIINEKLDTILKNQQKIYEAIVSVSGQIEDVAKHLDARIDQVAYEQRRIDSNIKALLWDKWTNCYSVYRYSLNPDSSKPSFSYVQEETLSFRSFEDARAVIAARPQQLKDCISTIQNALVSVSATQWFGNFLDADRAFEPGQFTDPGTLTSTQKDDVARWHDLARSHKESIVVPATTIVFEWAKRKKLDNKTLLWLLSSRIEDVSQLDSLANVGRYNCNEEDEFFRKIRGLVCAKKANTEELAERLLASNLNTEILLEISDWMAVVAPLANLYDSENQSFAQSILDIGKNGSPSIGKDITGKLADMLTLSISYYNRVYGGLTALALAEDLVEGRSSAMHVTALKNNPYLADNVASIVLHMKLKTWDLQKPALLPSFENRYAQALVYSREAENDKFEPLYALFGREHRFEEHVFVKELPARTSLVMKSGEEEVFLALPAPIILSEGRIQLPPRYYNLLQRRDQVADQFQSYEIGGDDKLAEAVLLH